ncbi:helicase-associated domain-containing protein [Frankia sp. Ag45/Mut15]|uniref:Helicase-associated domain-containing protein n=1 Tax=Frankia umida TaxID=573489 RepID=A0ABT0JSA1_9ACTN|nr:helicase-associated domain-containing protein [Frankia umida]MCK9874438.1 helicase-associated domain-containing protein [Frankia umida]
MPADEAQDESVTLADWLRAQPDEAIIRLFLLRPDLATPPPPDFTVLAARMEVRVSVTRVVDRLDTFVHEVLQALTVLPAGASLAELTAFTGHREVAAAVRRLRELGLLWGDDTALRIVGMAVDLVGERPLGLGRPVRQCLSSYRNVQLNRLAAALGGIPSQGVGAGSGSDRDGGGGWGGPGGRPDLVSVVGALFDEPARIHGWVESCTPRARELLERLASETSLGSTTAAHRVVPVEQARTPVEELLARGLIIGIDDEKVELPREVGLVVRGGTPAGPLHPRPPELEGTAIGVASVDAAAALTAQTIVRWVTTIVEAWGETPLTPLRTGGLSVRDLRATARLLDTDERVAAFVVELAWAAGLVDATTGNDVQFMPTAAYDRWGTEPIEVRWAVLVDSWLRAPIATWLIGERDERGRQIAALSSEVRRGVARELRADVLRALGAAPAGMAPSAASLRALLAWRAPRRTGTFLDRTVESTVVDAELLGVTGRGAPSTVGRVIIDRLETEAADPAHTPLTSGRPAGGDTDLCQRLADVLGPLLPEPVEELLLQADLTAVAPGPLVPRVAARLARMADIESTGAATVYRFTEESLRRAFDSGLTAEDLHDDLARWGRTGIPQGLTYLIDDTARRHGRMRAGPAASYLRCDDTALLSEVVVSRGTQALGLRRIAPTIVISSLPVNDLLAGLREAGYAPVAEAPDGRVLLSRPTTHRTPARARSSSGDVADSRLAQARDVLRLVRRGDDSARTLRAARSTDIAGFGLTRSAPLILTMLQDAVREKQRILLGYVDQQGTPRDRIVRPTALDGGWLTAWDELTDQPRRFALHRVTGIAELGRSGGTPAARQDSDASH